MPIITGPALDEIVKELQKWYLDTREMLIQALEEGYPYGNVPMSPSQQVDKFMSMTEKDWEVLISRLSERHRGEPNVQELVRADLQDYIQRMTRLSLGGGSNVTPSS